MTNPKTSVNDRRSSERLPPSTNRVTIALEPLVPGRKPCSGHLVNISSGGMAIRLKQVLPTGSHWALTLPGVGGEVLLKMMRSQRESGGHVHGFRFSSIQTMLAEQLGGGKRAKAKKRRD